MKRSFFVFFILIFFMSGSFADIPDSLYGIWEGKDRFVFFEKNGGEDTQIVMLLKTYYGWYYDRAVEGEDKAENESRTRNSATTKKAEKIYFDIGDVKNGNDFCSFELGLEYSRRQKSLVPILIYDDKIYLNFYLRDEENPRVFRGHSVSRGITMYEQPLSENIGVLYLTDDGNSVYDVRYWKSDMDFEISSVLFKRDEIEFSVPKHVMSQNQNYSCVSGRSKKIRNPQGATSLEKRGLNYRGNSAFESPFLIEGAEPYLVRLADKKTFEDLMQLVKEANSRRKPDPPALFPPHDPPLDWHWDIIDALEKNNPYIQAVRERQKAFGKRAKDTGR